MFSARSILIPVAAAVCMATSAAVAEPTATPLAATDAVPAPAPPPMIAPPAPGGALPPGASPQPQFDPASPEGRAHALHAAITAGDAAQVKRLLADGRTGPDAPDPLSADLPLARAIGENQRAIAAILIEAKADVNAGSLLSYAARADAGWAVDLLLAKGADVAGTGKEGWTALHHACQGNRTGIARALLDHKAAVKKKTTKGATPLHLAVAADKPDKALVALLLERGAYLNEENGDGDTALHLVAWRDDCPEIVSLLLAAKPDLSAQNEAGETPLHVAAKAGNLEVVKALLKLKPDLTLTARNGPQNEVFGKALTPYQTARANHHREAADLIAAAEKVAAENKNAGGQAK